MIVHKHEVIRAYKKGLRIAGIPLEDCNAQHMAIARKIVSRITKVRMMFLKASRTSDGDVLVTNLREGEEL